MEYNYIKIGERFRSERKKLGVSQEKLLNNIRDKGKPTFGRNKLSDIENGKQGAFKEIDLAQLMALCEEFDCSISYLLGEYEARNYDNKFICESTGLWENNITRIKEYGIIFINALISSKYFFGLSESFLSIIDSLSDWQKYHIPLEKGVSAWPASENEREIKLEMKYDAYDMSVLFGNFTREYVISDSQEPSSIEIDRNFGINSTSDSAQLQKLIDEYKAEKELPIV